MGSNCLYKLRFIMLFRKLGKFSDVNYINAKFHSWHNNDLGENYYRAVKFARRAGNFMPMRFSLES